MYSSENESDSNEVPMKSPIKTPMKTPDVLKFIEKKRTSLDYPSLSSPDVRRKEEEKDGTKVSPFGPSKSTRSAKSKRKKKPKNEGTGHAGDYKHKKFLE